MWLRKRLDIRLSDVAYGVYRCLLPPEHGVAQRNVEAFWSPLGDVLSCLSVRSGFDLLLRALDLAPGSEVLVSAVTIPHMTGIIRRHGLVPVPVDLDADTLAPRIDAMRRALTPQTRAVLVAHLFGSRFDLEPILGFARAHGLLLIEDNAQAFDGADRGELKADVGLFSFGPIKTSTALGGAIVRVRNPCLLGRLSLEQAALPSQSRLAYLARLLKYAVLVSLSTRTGFGTVVLACRTFGRDYDRFLTSTARSFGGDGFYEKIRRKPSPALLALLERRLRRFDDTRFADRIARGELLLELLREHVYCPGWAAPTRTHWVFPILVDKPGELIGALREAGFDASRCHSLCVVDPPDERPEVEPSVARAMLAHLVFLPVYPEMPLSELRRMAETVLTSAGRRLTRPDFEPRPARTPKLRPGPARGRTPVAGRAAS